MTSFFGPARDQTTCWSITLDCSQPKDDNAQTNEDNLFKIEMHKSPGGGWYWRVVGEVAFDWEDMPGLEAQMDALASALGWKE